MAFFDWDDKLATGIPLIDEQHRKLVSYVNELHAAMLARKGKEAIGGILAGLKDYTVYHFATEERAFATYGYPNAPEHSKRHAEFVAKVLDIYGGYERDEIGVTVKTLDFLIDWVKNHIMKEDKQYVPFMKGKDLQA